VCGRERERAEQPGRDDRLDRDPRPVRLEHADERAAVGHWPARGLVELRTDARHDPPDVDDAHLHDQDRGGKGRFEGEPGGDVGERRFEGLGSSAASMTAAMTSSLSAKARKIVPSAIPAPRRSDDS